ncbi:MAG: hypothetical protein ACYCXJ_04830 [Thermoleophilia bacterium]
MSAQPPTLAPGYKIYGALGIGLAAAIAIRALIVLDHVEPDWVRPVWYFAILGNFVFFYYRYQITRKRKKAVREHALIEKISSEAPLEPEDRVVLVYLLSSIRKSPENINYLIIFLFSLVAIALDLGFVLLD